MQNVFDTHNACRIFQHSYEADLKAHSLENHLISVIQMMCFVKQVQFRGFVSLYLHLKELEINDTTDIVKSDIYLDIHLKTDGK